MPIAEKINKYSVSVFQTNLQTATRQIRLNLELGGTASISFQETLPSTFVEFSGSATRLFMTTEQFTDVYHVLQTENPAFFTALNLFGLQIGSVHTELNLSLGETPGEGPQDLQSLEALIRHLHGERTDRT
jgi:hypothetical protein